MNTAEKIAATYLRLNGFLLLPHFTTFNGNYHGHVDIVALRAANSQECLGDFIFPIDDAFWGIISGTLRTDAKKKFIGAIAEVKTGDEEEFPAPIHVDYIQTFLGDAQCIKISFSQLHDKSTFDYKSGTICISLTYAFKWILSRFSKMDEQKMRLTKDGSWTLSEDFLSEILVFRKYKLFSS